jgi:hypothetical protein
VKEGLTSPMERLEPTLCCMLKFGSQMGQYVSQRQCIDIANELIKGKKIGRIVAEWMLKHNPATRRRLMYDRSYYPEEKVGTKRLMCISNVKHYRGSSFFNSRVLAYIVVVRSSQLLNKSARTDSMTSTLVDI